MTLYRSICGNTGVYSYEIGSDYINIRFKETPQIFRYSYLSAGKENVEKMMELAENGCKGQIISYQSIKAPL